MPEPSPQAAARRGGVARFFVKAKKTRDRIPPPQPRLLNLRLHSSINNRLRRFNCRDSFVI